MRLDTAGLPMAQSEVVDDYERDTEPPMNQAPQTEMQQTGALILELREDMADLNEKLDLIDAQNGLVINYCRAMAQHFGLRENIKQYDAQYERNKLDLRKLREKGRHDR